MVCFKSRNIWEDLVKRQVFNSGYFHSGECNFAPSENSKVLCQKGHWHSILRFIWHLILYTKPHGANLQWLSAPVCFPMLFLLKTSSCCSFFYFYKIAIRCQSTYTFSISARDSCQSGDCLEVLVTEPNTGCWLSAQSVSTMSHLNNCMRLLWLFFKLEIMGTNTFLSHRI